MKRTIRIFAVVMVLVGMSQIAFAGNDVRRGTAGASELLINPWARNTGWGGVNVANVRGVEAMFSNAAGLSFVQGLEVAYSNTMLYGGNSGLSSGASINAFGLGVRMFDRGVAGVYIMAMNFGTIDVTKYASPEPGSNGTFKPSYMNINVTYAHSFTKTIHGAINFKVISESTDNVSASGIGIDAGIQYVTGDDDQLKFGISLKNWGPTMKFAGTGLSLQMVNNAGNNFTVETRSAEMELPTCLNIGLSYDFLLPTLDQRITVAAAFTSNAFLRDNYTVGVEYSIMKMIELRAGYVMQPGMWGKNTATASNGICAGASFNVPLSKDENSRYGLTIDYSYQDASPLRGTHAIGASFCF